MVDIPYHTHTFDIPTASEGEIRAGIEPSKAITPDRLFPVLADKANKATTLAGYGIVDAATKGQGQKADTAVQPEQVSAVGFSGQYTDLLNKPVLGGSSGLNVGTIAGTVAAGDDSRIVNAVQKATTVSAGAGLTGGGTLAANIAFALSSTSLASLALADTAVQPAALLAYATKAELTTGLGGKSDVEHKHQISDVNGLQAALNGKATAAQGGKADTAVQPSDLGALAFKDTITTADITATGSMSGAALLTRSGMWVDPSGGGDMFRAVYDPNNKAVDAFSMASMAEATNAKVMTAAERTKLSSIASEATKNDTDANLKNRANHTGVQAIDTVTDLQSALDNRVRVDVAQALTPAQQGQARANIGGDLLGGFRNKIINGNFDIWQRGTTLATPSTNTRFLPDRWWTNGIGATLMTASRQSLPLGQTSIPESPMFFHRAVVTNFTGMDNEGAELSQNIEGVRTLAGKKATVTFWAKASITGNIGISVYQRFGTGGSPSIDDLTGLALAEVSNGWRKISVAVDIPPINGMTLGTNGDDYLSLRLVLCGGSGENARYTGGDLYAGNGTFDIARVSFVEGDATQEADPFSPRHIQQELALCHRYYVSFGGDVATEFIGHGQTPAVALANIGCSLLVAMRSIPTLSVSSPSDWRVSGANGVQIAATGISLGGGSTSRRVNLDVSVASGLTVGSATRMSAANLNARMNLDAEI